jgi:hypothetical protein
MKEKTTSEETHGKNDETFVSDSWIYFLSLCPKDSLFVTQRKRSSIRHESRKVNKRQSVVNLSFSFTQPRPHKNSSSLSTFPSLSKVDDECLEVKGCNLYDPLLFVLSLHHQESQAFERTWRIKVNSGLAMKI